MNIFTFLSFWVLQYPVEQMYLYGPRLGGWGFWCGLPPSSICQQLRPTQTPGFWEINEEECFQIIQSEIHSFMVSIYIILYVYIIYQTILLFSLFFQICIFKKCYDEKKKEIPTCSPSLQTPKPSKLLD